MTKQKEDSRLKSKRYLNIKRFNNDFDDTPDGAFFALAEEMYGIDIDDWVWFAEVQENDPDYKKETNKK